MRFIGLLMGRQSAYGTGVEGKERFMDKFAVVIVYMDRTIKSRGRELLS